MKDFIIITNAKETSTEKDKILKRLKTRLKKLRSSMETFDSKQCFFC